jgi:hypothetical protein
MLSFQRFILGFNKKFFTLRLPVKEGIRGEREGDFVDNFNGHNILFFTPTHNPIQHPLYLSTLMQ